MDHLPSVERPSYLIPQVLYLCRDDFDDFNIEDFIITEDFIKYPEKLGFVMEPSDLIQRNLHELNPFLQEWLYFGLLAKVWSLQKIRVNKSDFIRRNAKGELVITSQRLKWYISRWLKPRKLDFADQLILMTELQVVMRRVYQYTEALDASEFYGNNPNVELSVHGALFLSLILLQEAIQVMSHSWFGCDVEDLAAGLPAKDLMFLKVKLRANHWCESHIETYSNIASGLYFLGLLPPRRERNHSNCSRAACMANQIDLDTYRTQHITECPGCDFLGVDPIEVGRILCAGHIPVVMLTVRGDQYSLKVHSSQHRQRYVAVSHVWSDGLGNPSKNSLPLCQLRRLADLCGQADNPTYRFYELRNRLEGNTWATWCLKIGIVLWEWCIVLWSIFTSLTRYVQPSSRSGIGKSTFRETRFWIDTLCVPVVDRSSDSRTQSDVLAFRKHAIHKMKDTYKGAEEVLVLDSHLQTLGYTAYEAMVGLSLCDWMTRLWTLQEAAFGGFHVFWQFSNAVVFNGGIAFFCYENVTLSPASVLQARTPVQILTQILLIWSIWPRGDNSIFRFGEASPTARLNLLIHFLGSRSTSKPRDETVCIEAMIGTDHLSGFGEPFEPDQGYSPLETLLKKFHRSLPSGVLFVPGVRGTTQGMRWAPKSFLSCPSRDDDLLSIFQNAVLPTMLETVPSVFLKALETFWKLVFYLEDPTAPLNYLTSATVMRIPRWASLRDDGLCCRLDGWVFTRSNRIKKNKDVVHMVGHKTDQALVFWTFTRWCSLIDENATLPDDWLDGSIAVLWRPQTPVMARQGVLVKLSETSSWDEEYVRIYYQYRVEARPSRVRGQRSSDWEARFNNEEITRAIEKNDQGWCVD